MMSLQDVTTWHKEIGYFNPTLETSVVMVHCDRFIESDTKGTYRSEERTNL